jgi:hypothetical protein
MEPAVRLERHEDGPDLNGSYERGWRFLSGEGLALIEAYIPNAQPSSGEALVFMFGENGVPVDLVPEALPNLLAVPNERASARRWVCGKPGWCGDLRTEEPNETRRGLSSARCHINRMADTHVLHQTQRESRRRLMYEPNLPHILHSANGKEYVMLPLYDDSKTRYQERLDEADLQRLIKLARVERAATVSSLLNQIGRYMAARFPQRETRRTQQQRKAVLSNPH